MPTICMLGDSHVAAMRTGWKVIKPEYPDVQMSFFAAPGATLRGLAVSDGRLVAGTEALQGYLKRSKKKVTTIEPGFDMYLTCGLGLQLGRAAEAMRIFVAATRSEPSVPARDDLFAGICAALRKSPAADTLQKLREITAVPLGAIPAPMHGAGRPAPIFAKIQAAGRDEIIAQIFAEASVAVVREHGAVYIPQPTQTLGANRVTTDAKFATEPAKFFVYDVIDDMRHMNATYGELMMRQVLEKMLGQNRTG